jgi:hypothetical protein
MMGLDFLRDFQFADVDEEIILSLIVPFPRARQSYTSGKTKDKRVEATCPHPFSP